MDPLGTPEVTRASDDTITIYYYLLASATERLSTQDIKLVTQVSAGAYCD